MAASNLAIVFGPNLLRARVENMQTMMHDMPYKCIVIEALVQQTVWMFDQYVPPDGEHDETTAPARAGDRHPPAEQRSGHPGDRRDDRQPEHPGGDAGEHEQAEAPS